MSDGIDVSKIKPLGTHMLVRKCVTAKPDLIEVPEQYIEQCEFGEILAVGPKCKVFKNVHIGMMVKMPEMADGMHALQEGSSEFWMIREELLEPVVYE